LCQVYNINNMETNEKTMTPEESIQIIRNSILNSRKNLKENGFYYLLWGWLLVFASLTNFFLIRYLHARKMYDQIFIASSIAWGVFVFVGFAIVFFYLGKKGRKNTVLTHLDRIITTLWMTAGVVFVLIVLFCYRYESYPTPYILAITGMVTFSSGIIVRFKPLIAGGIVFGVISVVSIFVPPMSQLLLVAISLVLGFLIPGYLLKTAKD
jgi:hypothetical protein